MNVGTYIVDALLIMKDAGAITSSAAATVGGSAKVLDLVGALGPAPAIEAAPRTRGDLVVDVTAITSTADNKDYVILQASSTSDFSADVVNLAILDLSQGTGGLGGQITGTTGRYVVPFINYNDQVPRRYLRVNTILSGTSPSINYTATISPRAAS